MRFFEIKKNFSGFTIIEILVVVSIIGLVTTAAIYYVNNSREKARMAGALHFSGSLKTSMAINLVSYWPLDAVNSNITPDIWNKNNGTLVNAPVLADGVFNKALQFNGSNRIDVPSMDLVDFGNKITIEAWINYSGGSRYKNIINRGGTDFGLALDPNNKVHFETYTGVVNCCWRSYGKSLKINKWYHIVGVYDGSKMRAYVDGILQPESLNQSGDINNSPGEIMTIGDGTMGWGDNFVGIIDEVKIYNEALTAQEIQEHYAKNSPKYDLAVK